MEEDWVLYDTAEACASGAAPIFKRQQWKWSASSGICDGVPNEGHIYTSLLRLKRDTLQGQYDEDGNLVTFSSGRSGRLIYVVDGDKYGHQPDPDSGTK